NAEIAPNETTANLETLTAQYHDQFQPATPEEVTLVDLIVRNEWLLRRMAAVEGGYWEQRFTRYREYGEPPPQREILGKDLTRIQWRLNSIQRNLFEATDRLKALQATRQLQPPNHLPKNWLRSRVPYRRTTVTLRQPEFPAAS